MENWQSLLAIALLVLLLTIKSAAAKKRNRKEREFTRKLELVLQPRENIKVICPQKSGSCILTTKRLLFETRDGFSAVPLEKIKRVQGVNDAGKATASVPKMVRLVVKAEKEYTLHNASEHFAELAKQLISKIKQKNKKK